jgi:hypothetical protein
MIRTTKITIKRVKIIFYTKIKCQWMKFKDKLFQSRIQELKEWRQNLIQKSKVKGWN